MSSAVKKPTVYVKVNLSEDQCDQPEEDGFVPQRSCWDDFPSIVASIAAFISFMIYGATAGSLGASLPALAVYFKQSEARFGLVFTARGIGYFLGTISSAAVLEIPSSLKNYKSIFVCIASLVIGVFTSLIPISTSFHFVLMLIWLQGFGFGMIDTFANCLLPELWGLRVGPWMQALHCCFGIGAIIGPAMIGLWKFQRTFTILGSASVVPAIIIFFYHLIKRYSHPPLPTVHANGSEPLAAAGDQSAKEESSESDIIIPPISIKLLLTTFFFVYVGAETSFGAWISAYVLNIGVTDSERHAAYLASYFWGSLAFGRLLAIFLAVYTSNTNMLRFQLFLCIVSTILMLVITSASYSNASIVSMFYGFALSSIFPLVMTLVTDYGYTM
jgi:MFS transporter, FHS family, Na+ dependent glucose transporter 1